MNDYTNRSPKDPEQVRKLFDRLAPRYEFNDHLFSLGIDSYWRRVTTRRLQPAVSGPLLDGATGSGQLAISLARYYPDRFVTGLDFSPGMLAVGRKKIARHAMADRLKLVEGDLLAMPLPDKTFAAATVAFGVRNVADRQQCLREFFRVLKPGARLLVLEFGMPALPIIGPLYRWYFGAVMPWLADRLGAGESFRYLFQSVDTFPKSEAFLEMLREAGFINAIVTPLTLGIARLFQADAP